MTATFDFGEDGTRITGEVLQKNAKTASIKTTLPEDFGGEVITLKRHIAKHNVTFDPASQMWVEVINIREFKPPEEEYVYIGRGSPLGNKWTHMKTSKADFVVSTRDESIRQYELWILERIKYRNPQSTAIHECTLRLVRDGHLKLGCFCVPLACHGEVLAEIIMKKAKDHLDTLPF